MNFQTNIPLKEQKPSIDYSSRLLLIGSCFTENVGKKFEYFKFQTTLNPFGILFHPLAIENLISRAVNKNYYTEDDILHNNDQWLCVDAHSKCNRQSSEELLEYLNGKLDACSNALLSATHLVLTLGTSWVYRHIESGQIVANCHKLPQKDFLKELLSPEAIASSLQNTIALCKHINPDITMICTVSPVRHLKDGFQENMRSKAHLLTAVHQNIADDAALVYFPSYELMIDELRDYRFYADDMIHPSELAINYIWSRFSEVWVSDAAKSIMKKVDSIQKRLLHRPFNPTSKPHLEFNRKIKSDIIALNSEIPHLSFSE